MINNCKAHLPTKTLLTNLNIISMLVWLLVKKDLIYHKFKCIGYRAIWHERVTYSSKGRVLGSNPTNGATWNKYINISKFVNLPTIDCRNPAG